MLSKVKDFCKVNVKAVVVSMMIAMITVLSAISCFAEGETWLHPKNQHGCQ